jgi:membrane protease YdiL (CAAX protease family)
VLCYGAWLFPHEIWKIAFVGVGWFFFSRSMAEKSVTLVTIASESGEVQKVPAGRRWAAQLGMFTFCIGIITQQWHMAIMGIVYSWMTAAAMWQNFRARLPYLYDPWSEVLPKPPTLMHAMISISVLIEIGAIVTGILSAIFGHDNVAIAQALSYGICAVVVMFFVSNFLDERGVKPSEVWHWRAGPLADDAEPESWWRAFGFAEPKFLLWLLAGTGSGAALGLFGRGYMALLAHLPWTAELIRKSQEQMAQVPYLHLSYAVMAVLFAPFAEEYLFRGLLFRALDREWGGWAAVLGSAAFFAIYHQPLAWLPVGLLGVANALIFKRSRSLLPAILLHMAYNAVIVS